MKLIKAEIVENDDGEKAGVVIITLTEAEVQQMSQRVARQIENGVMVSTAQMLVSEYQEYQKMLSAINKARRGAK